MTPEHCEQFIDYQNAIFNWPLRGHGVVLAWVLTSHVFVDTPYPEMLVPIPSNWQEVTVSS
jgi:hypothetical protein